MPAAVTALLLTATWGASYVPLGWIRSGAPGFPPQVRLSLLALGLQPLYVGFLLVELFSLTSGRNLRQGGLAGRARLDRAALAAGLLVAAVQAAGIAFSLSRMVTAGEPVVAHPGGEFILFTVVTLTAATAALFALATAISRWGIGNGFCWMIGLQTILVTERAWRHQATQAAGDSARTNLLFSALTVVPFFALAAWLSLRREEVKLRAEGGALPLALPTLPQGIEPLLWTQAILSFAASRWAVSRLGLPQITPLYSILGRLLLIPAFSFLTFALFANRRRMAANLAPLAEVPAEISSLVDRRFVRTTALLTAGALGLYLLWRYLPVSVYLGLDVVFVLTAITLDLRDELSFAKRHSGSAHLLQLDNVHLASYLRSLLAQQGIEALPRAHRFRALYFFFYPLVKIDLLVPAGRLDEARALIPAGEIRIA